MGIEQQRLASVKKLCIMYISSGFICTRVIGILKRAAYENWNVFHPIALRIFVERMDSSKPPGVPVSSHD